MLRGELASRAQRARSGAHSDVYGVGHYLEASQSGLLLLRARQLLDVPTQVVWSLVSCRMTMPVDAGDNRLLVIACGLPCETWSASATVQWPAPRAQDAQGLPPTSGKRLAADSHSGSSSVSGAARICGALVLSSQPSSARPKQSCAHALCQTRSTCPRRISGPVTFRSIFPTAPTSPTCGNAPEACGLASRPLSIN